MEKVNGLIGLKMKRGGQLGALCVLIILMSVCGVVPTYAADYTLPGAWQRLLHSSDKLSAETASVERADWHREAAKSLYLPQVEVTGQYIHLNDDVDLDAETLFDNMQDGAAVSATLSALGLSADLISSATTHLVDQDNFIASLSAVWPIYTGGRIDAAQDIAAGQYKEAEQHRVMIQRQQFQELVKRYFGVVLAEQVVQTRIRVEQGLKHHLRNATLLVEQGQISRVERLQAAAASDKAGVERKKAEHQLKIAQIALDKMLGVSEEVIPVDALFINGTMPEMDYFLQKTYDNYPGLGILRAKREQATGMVAVQKGKYQPEVALMGDYSIQDNNSLTTALAPDWFVGVGVSFTIFDRDGRYENLQQAHTATRQVDFLIAQAQKDLSILTEQTYSHAEQAYDEYEGLASSIELGRESVELRYKSFSQGLSTSLDVVDAEMFLAGVSIQRSVAVYNYVVALSQLLVLSGDVDHFAEYQQRAVTQK